MEEDFGAEEAFVSDVHVEGFLGDGVDSGVLLHPLVRVLVVLGKLLCDVRTHVAKSLLKTVKGTSIYVSVLMFTIIHWLSKILYSFF